MPARPANWKLATITITAVLAACTPSGGGSATTEGGSGEVPAAAAAQAGAPAPAAVEVDHSLVQQFPEGANLVAVMNIEASMAAVSSLYGMGDSSALLELYAGLVEQMGDREILQPLARRTHECRIEPVGLDGFDQFAGRGLFQRQRDRGRALAHFNQSFGVSFTVISRECPARTCACAGELN